MTKASVVSVGSYLPQDVITNADLEQLVETSDTWIMERTGIRTRHRAGLGEGAAAMGAKAASQALQETGNPKVDAIVCATCSPDTFIPSSAAFIQRELGLLGIPVFDLNAACSGFIYATVVANSLIQSGVAQRVLVVATEALTSLVDYTDRTTCVLFGDGAGACVMEACEDGGINATRWGADGSQAELIYYGPMQENEDSKDGVRMLGKGTFKLAVDRLCAMAVELCEEAGWSIEDVDLFIPHQANLRIIESAAKRVGVPMNKVMINLDEVGNTSAASIPLAMKEAVGQGRLKRGDKVVCVTFGAGVTWGGIALEWN